MTTKKVVAYIRVSTDKQSVENQLNELTSVADRNGWELVHTYCDKGISGASTGVVGALRIIEAHNQTAGSVTIGPSLCAQFGLIDPTKLPKDN